MSKANLVALHLRSCAWWRLDSAGATAIQVARSVVALLDAAVYLQDLPDDDPDIRALTEAGRFSGEVFDPGPAGAWVIRGWKLSSQVPTDPRDLLAALARAASDQFAAGDSPSGERPAGSLSGAASRPAVPVPRPASSSGAAPVRPR